VTGGQRKLQNYELRNFYPSSNIIRIMGSRIMRWLDQAESTEMRFAYRILGRYCERLNAGTILKPILGKYDVMM
jgi:hypothetical protein